MVGVFYLCKKKNMNEIQRNGYALLLGTPCELFIHYNVKEMHGLNADDCAAYLNTKDDAYFWGLANYAPKEDKLYSFGDKRFVFINLQRCGNDFETFGGVYHELMHHSLEMHDYNMDLEEEIISWAENESHEVFKIVVDNL